MCMCVLVCARVCARVGMYVWVRVYEVNSFIDI